MTMFWQVRTVEALHQEKRGQGSIEYVLLIMAVVLFIIATTFLLRDVLSAAIAAAQTYITSLTAP